MTISLEAALAIPITCPEGELIRTHGRRYAKLLEPYTKSGRLLDVGAAGGFLLSGFFDHRWQGDGLEPNGTMAHYAQSMLGVNVVQGAWKPFHLRYRAGSMISSPWFKWYRTFTISEPLSDLLLRLRGIKASG